MLMFDANMILRYLLNDNAVMAEKVEQYLDTGNVLVTIEVIAEVVYVLKGVYSLECDEVADILRGLLELVSCRDGEVLNFALDTFGKHNLDFVDCVLYAYNRVKGIDIATFDKKLLKLLSETR